MSEIYDTRRTVDESLKILGNVFYFVDNSQDLLS